MERGSKGGKGMRGEEQGRESSRGGKWKGGRRNGEKGRERKRRRGGERSGRGEEREMYWVFEKIC